MEMFMTKKWLWNDYDLLPQKRKKFRSFFRELKNLTKFHIHQ